MKPKAIPLLTREQFTVITRDMERTPTAADLKRIEQAKELLRNNFL